MNTVFLRFAAPLQSWATSRVTGNIVRTERVPSRSGVVGLLAASLGAPRDAWPAWLADLMIEVRSEWTGEFIDDFQTINPRDEDLEYQQRTYTLMTGKRWIKSAHFTPDGEGGTAIVRRTYLANAEFLVAITAERHFDELVAAIRAPKFSTYPGRKAFAPVFPFYLGVGDASLLESLPTAERAVSVAKRCADERRDAEQLDESEVQPVVKELRIDTFLPGSLNAQGEEGPNLAARVPSQVIRSQNVDQTWRTVTVPKLERKEWVRSIGESLAR